MQPVQRGRRPPLGLLGSGAIGLAAALLAGCNLFAAPVPPPTRPVASASERPAPPPEASNEVPTLRPEPSGSGPDLVDATDALADLGSYRVSVVSRGLVPAAEPDGTVSLTSTLVQGEEPAAAFTLVGLDGLTGGRLEAVLVGDQAWLKSGSEPWRKSPGGAADFDAAFTTLSPIDLVAGFERLGSAILRDGTPAEKDGQRAIRYHGAATDAAVVAAGLSEGSAEIWLGSEDGHLVALAILGTWDVDGTPTPIELRIDVSHVDDPANWIRPPA